MDTAQVNDKEMKQQRDGRLPKRFPLLISSLYTLFLSLGSIVWFFLLAFLLIRFRRYINIKVINLIIRGLGVILCIIGLFFAYSAVRML